MKQFSTLSELKNHIGSSQGQHRVFGTNKIKYTLKEAANLLYKIMFEELQAYYDSYTPVEGGYTRTYNLLNSLRISPIIQEGNTLKISVYFDRDAATHSSLFGVEAGYVANLINEGWKWNKDIGINHLSYYEGFHFVEKSILRFNAINKWGFKISKNSVKK
jgi:hypothetical protein